MFSRPVKGICDGVAAGPHASPFYLTIASTYHSAVYEVMKPIFAALLSSGDDGSNKAVAFLLASVVAGAVAALLLCPMESTRIKMVIDPAYAEDNLLSALARLAATEGLGSSFGGLWAMLSKQVPYTFGKQVSFDVFAGVLYSFFGALQQQWNAISDGNVKWAVSVFAAAGASLIACILSQPGDMILTETYKPKKLDSSVESVTSEIIPMQAVSANTEPSTVSNLARASRVASAVSVGPALTDKPAKPFPSMESITSPAFVTPSATKSLTSQEGATAPTNAETSISTAFADVVSRLYREGGVAKFFTGTQARIVHVGLIITSQLVVYDIVKQLLGLPATGSH